MLVILAKNVVNDVKNLDKMIAYVTLLSSMKSVSEIFIKQGRSHICYVYRAKARNVPWAR